jgi:hypothetical protein
MHPELEVQPASALEGWDYLAYDKTLGHRFLGRIVPDLNGTMGIVYRVETLDGERLQDGHLPWEGISDQIQLLPLSERDRSSTDRAVTMAIRAAFDARV